MFTWNPRRVDLHTVCSCGGWTSATQLYKGFCHIAPLPFRVKLRKQGWCRLGSLPSAPPTHAPLSPLSSGLHAWFCRSYVLEHHQRVETLLFPVLCTPPCLWCSWPLHWPHFLACSSPNLLLSIPCWLLFFYLLRELLPKISPSDSRVPQQPSRANVSPIHISKPDHLLDSRFDFLFSISYWTCPTLTPLVLISLSLEVDLRIIDVLMTSGFSTQDNEGNFSVIYLDRVWLLSFVKRV